MINNRTVMDRYLPPETSLIPVIKAGRNTTFRPCTAFVEEEVNSGFGIADVVFFNLDNEKVEKRKKANVPAVKSFEILETFAVVSKLGTPDINITYLYKQLPYSEKTFKNKILNFLVESGMAANINNTYLKFNYIYETPLLEVVAIEAKVSNWKRGLYQAYRYRQYADFSYLALHKFHIENATENIDLFESMNVGLIKVDEEKQDLEIIFRPKQDNLSITNRVRYCASEEILLKQGLIQASV